MKKLSVHEKLSGLSRNGPQTRDALPRYAGSITEDGTVLKTDKEQQSLIDAVTAPLES